MLRKTIILFIWLTALSAGALAQEATEEAPEGRAVITSPAPGDALFGNVQVMGIATHPAFRRFELEFATMEAPEKWIPVQEAVSQQVPSGILGVWDVSSLPDGVYTLRLRVFSRDGEAIEATAGDLRIANTQPTHVPTVLPTPTAGPTQPPATEGPSPTPIIQQPPTVTPRPGGGAALAGGAAPGTGEERLNASMLQAACCNGIYLTLVILALGGLYLAVRPSLRPWLRRMLRRR